MALLNNIGLAGQNYLPYSSYNSSGWTSTAADAGTISVGSKFNFSVQVADDLTITQHGVQTWDGAGVITLNDAIDMSSWTSFCFAVEVGQYQQSTAESLAITLYASDGVTTGASAGWTLRGNRRAWLTASIADFGAMSPSAVYLNIESATDCYWWLDDAQLEADVTRPGQFLPTSGSAVNVSADQLNLKTVMKVCRQCRRRFFHTYAGVIQKEIQAPLDVDIEVLP